MVLKKGFLTGVLLLCQLIFAQHDSITQLREVVVSDRQLKQFSGSQSVLRLNDSVVEKNRPLLTDLLRYNSVIYFKENGPGMVSSPSFRGTTAQQTAVIWNGLNVNSSFNGQIDFNTVATGNFSSISVRAGGGSVIYGSSAIGGSVHLNNELSFGRRLAQQLDVSVGSFNTSTLNYNLDAATERTVIQASIVRNASDNDFEFPGSNRRNANGQYENTGFNIGFGYKLNRTNNIRFYSYLFDGERHFSLISPTETKTKYTNFNARNLLEWTNEWNRLTSTVKIAWLNEQYEYYSNLLTMSNYGTAETFIAKYDANYQIGSNMQVNALIDYVKTDGDGSDLADAAREVGSIAVLFRHRPTAIFGYELGARKEITQSYQCPFLFSAGADYKIGKHYTLKVNGSKNFRIPTFNDLYWADGGNQHLKPESSIQVEIGNEIKYQNLVLSVTGYYIDIDNLIQWLPGTAALWNPVNAKKVETYGAEIILGWDKKIAGHYFNAAATYAYTVSKNGETGHQLIYVPYHKATASLAYGFKRFTADAQWLFNGEVFTRSDNNPRYNIEPYGVANFSIGYAVGKAREIKVGARMLNVFDENYQVVAGRPFPGRNFNLYLNLNF